MVSFANRAATPTHVLVRILDRESVLLNLETEQYFGLDGTGTRMWQLVTGSPNIDAAYHETSHGIRCRTLNCFGRQGIPSHLRIGEKRKSLKHTLGWSAMGSH